MKLKTAQSLRRILKLCALGVAVLLVASILIVLSFDTGPETGPTDLKTIVVSKWNYITTYVAAVRGDGAAQIRLGRMYRGLDTYNIRATKWYRKAAKQGDIVAQFQLGTWCRLGQGVAQDYSEALKWYKKSADQGYRPSQYELGKAYRRGRGVPQDNVEAYKWYYVAAFSGFTAVTERNEFSGGFKPAVTERNELLDSMTPEQIAEAERRVTEYIKEQPAANRNQFGIPPVINKSPSTTPSDGGNTNVKRSP